MPDVDSCEALDRFGGGLVVEIRERSRLTRVGVVPRIATARGVVAWWGAGQADDTARARPVPSSRSRDTFASVGASRRRPVTSSRKSSGLPAVASQQAAQKASSASGESVVRRSRVVASMLRGAGRIMPARGSETIWPSKPGSSPGSSGRSPTTTSTSSPSRRGKRYANQRNEGRSHQCRSSTAKRSGWRVERFAVSQ
jgi:hypothetical protein